MKNRISTLPAILTLVLSLVISGSVLQAAPVYADAGSIDPRSHNTDSDVEDVDGYYTFTGNNDWYGYESYLNYDGDSAVGGRIYMVTLPEDGRLQVEISGSGNSWTCIDAAVNYLSSNLNYEQTWCSGKENFSLNATSDILDKGVHMVRFFYSFDGYALPGKNYFYHKVTFKTLNSDEKVAYTVIQKIEALDEHNDLTISDEAAVKAARNAYNNLSDTQKQYVSRRITNRLQSCESGIDYLKKQFDVKNATITGITAKVYNGKSITQSPVVELNGKKLVRGTDYKLSYKNNKAVGKATVTISGIGSYFGSVNKSFKINPKATTMSAVKAGRKAFTAKWNKPGAKYLGQISGYQIRYSLSSSMRGAKTVTVSGARKTSKAVKKLKANMKYYVQVRTYKTTANKTKYYSKWSKAKSVRTKK